MRIGSARSEVSTGAPACGGIAAVAAAEARRTSGSGSRAARATRSACAASADGARSDSAVARTIAGCVASSMTAASRALAPGGAGAAGSDGGGEGRPLGSLRAVPPGDGRRGPRGGPVGVARRARVGRAELDALVRTRHLEPVVEPRVHHHVVARGHVTRPAIGGRRAGAVVGVGRRVEGGRHVALRAEGVALELPRTGMRAMAIGAGHARGVHLALQERTVLEDLVALLAVGLVEPVVEQRHAMRAGQGLAVLVVEPALAAASVAPGAGLDFRARRQGRGPLGNQLTGRHRPRAARGVAHREDESFRRVGGAGRGIASPPGDVGGPWAVARLTRDVDLRPGRGVGLRLRAVVLLKVRGVALRARVVPVLRQRGPVQDVTMVDLLALVGVEPPLATLLTGARVPRHAERLVPPAGHLERVLLQRAESKRVLHVEVGEPAVGAVGADAVASAVGGERRLDAVVGEPRSREVTLHGAAVGHLHGLVMVGDGPLGEGVGVARGAGLRADERWRGLGWGRGASPLPPHATSRPVRAMAAATLRITPPTLPDVPGCQQARRFPRQKILFTRISMMFSLVENPSSRVSRDRVQM